MTEKKEGNFAIFFASFATLLAAGMGFAIRGGGILGEWEAQYGFTKQDLGTITGGGLIGFGVTIIIFSLIIELIGYKPLLILAFLLHTLSAVVTVAATPVYNAIYEAALKDSQSVAVSLVSTQETSEEPSADNPAPAGTALATTPEIDALAKREARDVTYWVLWVGMFMFALANGVCEAVINPLVATLYPRQKTHYLNILHAGWPGGLILGGALAYCFVGRDAFVTRLAWELPICFFLVPTVIYGLITFVKKFPISEARAAGVSFGEMLLTFASPILLFLFLLHAMVGYVELGTDSWITDIMNNIITGKAVLLFIYTSAIMFVLRFFAGPIVEKINPLGLLLVSAVLAAIGLYWLSYSEVAWAVIAAATVYGLGKTFFWPTMLGVVGERYPQGGALTMGTIGGIGMLSAGFFGTAGIGYKQDYYVSHQLQQQAPQVYDEYASDETKSLYGLLPDVTGLNGAKVAQVKDKAAEVKAKRTEGKTVSESEELTAEDDQVLAAVNYGGRMALRWTAAVPAAMAVGYLLLVLFYWATGGYKIKQLKAENAKG